MAKYLSPLRRLADLLGGYTTFTCPAADCDLVVRLRGTTAGERRRWQEFVADHHRHRSPRKERP
ncbi:hypothetical protein ABZW30_29005 [Kitasatospora sp. NPDC004669]|uniref:hypothetical protein n=1 Tax=Kitasatospora sp. NPDC004669 TaxID=3154555 RepID=UPI0033A78BDD